VSISNFVSIAITQDTVGVQVPGFGIPLILSHYASFPERIRFYGAASEVSADGFATTGPEYLAAVAMFSQSPSPEQIAIGRAANKPTQAYLLEVATVRNSHTYTVNVKGEGITSTAATYTSDGTATNDEIINGLLAAINGVVGNNYIAATTGGAGTLDLTVTGDVAGEWFSLEVSSVDDLKITQTHSDPGVAADLDAIKLVDDSWYAVHTAYNSNSYSFAVATWAEANKKLYVFDTSDSDSVTVAVGGGDTLDDIKGAAFARTSGGYHPSPAAMMSAALLGKCLALEPGSETWALKTLAGVPAVTLTATHRTNLVNKNANSYQTVAGVNVTFNGETGDGDFIDVQRGLDWVEANIGAEVFATLAGASKIPYTDPGVTLIQAAVSAVLDRAVARGIFADSPAPVVTVPRVANVSTANKSARILPDVKFSATLAGAVHKVNVTGVVSV
jgi:hypothetical protein